MGRASSRAGLPCGAATRCDWYEGIDRYLRRSSRLFSLGL